jgi:two-component system sensor histidine kinase BaeS
MRVVVALIAAVIAGALFAEATMQPTMSTRAQFLGLVAASAALAWMAAWAFPKIAGRIRRIRFTIASLAVVALLLVAALFTVAAALMFISSHDLQLALTVLVIGLVLGSVFAIAVSEPLASDLERIGETAGRVAGGDLTARTGVARSDEVGRAAAALDDMAGRLSELETERQRQRDARQAFLTAIGHDLRTPLAALRAAVEALQDDVAADPDRFLRSMDRDLEALTALVDDLFLLTRIESGDLELEMMRIDLAELADDAVEALRPSAARHEVEVKVEAPDRVPAVGGPGALSRVIRNLVDNAIRHSPPHGHITVHVEGNGSPTVSVVDQGPGFESDFVTLAFESFSRGDAARARATGGAGLGLAIAQGFIAAHGGEIWADSGPGGRVTFRLPTPTKPAA